MNEVTKAQGCANKALLFGFPPVKEIELLERVVSTIEGIVGHKYFTPLPLKIGGWKIVVNYKANNRVISYLIGANNEGKGFFQKGCKRTDYGCYSIISEWAFLMLECKNMVQIVKSNMQQ